MNSTFGLKLLLKYGNALAGNAAVYSKNKC